MGDVQEEAAIGRNGEAGRVDTGRHEPAYGRRVRGSAELLGRKRGVEARPPSDRNAFANLLTEDGINTCSSCKLEKPCRSTAKAVEAGIVPRSAQPTGSVAGHASSDMPGDHAQSSSSKSVGSAVLPCAEIVVAGATTKTRIRSHFVSGGATTTKRTPSATTNHSVKLSARVARTRRRTLRPSKPGHPTARALGATTIGAAHGVASSVEGSPVVDALSFGGFRGVATGPDTNGGSLSAFASGPWHPQDVTTSTNATVSKIERITRPTLRATTPTRHVRRRLAPARSPRRASRGPARWIHRRTRA